MYAEQRVIGVSGNWMRSYKNKQKGRCIKIKRIKPILEGIREARV